MTPKYRAQKCIYAYYENPTHVNKLPSLNLII